MGTLRRVILHHHIFKNAGTTLDFALRKNFGERYVAFESSDANPTPVDGVGLHRFLRSRPDVVGVTSHSFHGRRYDKMASPREFLFLEFVIFRHPIDRLVSIYDFYRAGGGGSEVQIAAARELTLDDWLNSIMERWPNMVNDVQVGMLSRRGVYVGPTSNEDLKRAKRRLARFSFIGTVERFDESCVIAEYFLQPALGKLDLACTPQNVARTRTGPADRVGKLPEIVGPKLYKRLSEMSRLDLELLAHVDEELDRRLALVHDFEHRRDEFNRRKALLPRADGY